MKTNEMNTQITPVTEPMQIIMAETSVSYASELTYNEMADIPVSRTNPLEQLRANVAALEDLNARMQFMTKEIRYLMKV